MRVSKKTLEEIESALREYENEVELSNITSQPNLPPALREFRPNDCGENSRPVRGKTRSAGLNRVGAALQDPKL